MSRAHYMIPTAPTQASKTVRLGAGNTANDRFDDKEINKLVKYAGDSRYDLCAVGDEIEGQITSIEAATADGYSIGGVNLSGDAIFATADGLQGTPGTGTIAAGDYVVAGTATAKGTPLAAHPKVCKATTQANVKASPFSWRVESVLTGAGAVGTTIVIRRQSAN